MDNLLICFAFNTEKRKCVPLDENGNFVILAEEFRYRIRCKDSF